MINIYFFPKNTGYYYFDESRVMSGATCWEGQLADDYKCVVTQTGEKEGGIYLLENDEAVITTAIADNNSHKINELMAALMNIWVPGTGEYVMPYAERSVSFSVFSTLSDGERCHGNSYEIMLAVKMTDLAVYLPRLRDLGVRILDPNIVLYCDVAIEYEPNIMRKEDPCYYDYATASSYSRHLFMHEIYQYNKRWKNSDEEELSRHNSDKRQMKYYNYNKEQMRELLYSGTGKMRELYTPDEVSAILQMRGEDEEDIQPTKLSVEEGKALAAKRAELNSSEGGFKDLVYPCNKLTRTLRLAIHCRSGEETTVHYQDVTELTIGEFNDRKAKFQREGDPIAAMAILCACKPAIFKTYFKTTEGVVWKVELQELLSWANSDDIKLNVLENLE